MDFLQKILAVVSLVFSMTSFASSQSVNSIALFNLRPISMDAIGADADLLYSLEIEFEKASQLSVMSRRDIEAILHRIGGAQVSDTNLVIAYGQEMGVSFILTGDVDKTGSSMQVTLKLVDIIGERVVNIWKESYTGRGDVLQGSKTLANNIKLSILNAVEANMTSTEELSTETEVEYFESIKAIAKNTGVFLSWAIKKDVPVFYTNVYRGQSEDGLFEFVASVEENQYQDHTKGQAFYRLDLVLENGNEIKGTQIVNAKASSTMVDASLLPPTILASENLLHGIKIDLVPQLNNKGVLGYNFYQKVNDDQWKKVHSINKTDQLKYSLVLNKNFTSDASYQLNVTSFSDSGESEHSDTLTLTTHPALKLSANKEHALRKAELSWISAKVGQGYKIFRRKEGEANWQLLKKVLGIANSAYTDNDNLIDEQRYQYSLTAFDEFTETPKSNEVAVETKPLPPAPKELKLQSNMIKSVEISWQAIEDKDISGYVVFRKEGSMKSGDLLDEIAFVEGYQATTYTDGLGKSPLTDGTKYFYAIAAKNSFGSIGKLSLAIDTQTKPLPHQPKNFSVTNENGAINLSWQANDEADINHYTLYRKWNKESWQKIAELKQTNYQDPEIKAYATTEYKITVTDNSGLDSIPSAIQKIQSPLILSLTIQNEFMPRAISLAWNDVKHIKGYKLYRKHSEQSQWKLIKTINKPSQNSYKDFDPKNLREGQVYQYKLTAFDEFLETPPSNIISGTTKALLTAPNAFVAQSNQVKLVTLQWSKSTDSDAEGYIIYQKNSKGIYEEIEKIEKTSTELYKDNGSFFASLGDGTSYSYKIATYNQFSAVGPLSDIITATTKAIPKTITGLSIEQDASGLMLFWQPLKNNDINHYQIHRSSNSSCSNSRKIATTAGSIDVYLDTDVSSGKSYCYQITAIDNDKLESKLSQQVSFTMPNTEQGK